MIFFIRKSRQPHESHRTLTGAADRKRKAIVLCPLILLQLLQRRAIYGDFIALMPLETLLHGHKKSSNNHVHLLANMFYPPCPSLKILKDDKSSPTLSMANQSFCPHPPPFQSSPPRPARPCIMAKLQPSISPIKPSKQQPKSSSHTSTPRSTTVAA